MKLELFVRSLAQFEFSSLTLIGMSYQSKKNAHLYRHLEAFFIRLAGCQINPIDVNFHLQKSLYFFDENSADKIWSKKNKEIKVSPLLMPIRVNWLVTVFWRYDSINKTSIWPE